MGGVTRMFSPPKADSGSSSLMEAQLDEQRQALDEQRRLTAEREAKTKADEDRAAATRRARAAGLAGRSLLLNDEVGIPPGQQKLGG
jgi:hypothetical protein